MTSGDIDAPAYGTRAYELPLPLSAGDQWRLLQRAGYEDLEAVRTAGLEQGREEGIASPS